MKSVVPLLITACALAQTPATRRPDALHDLSGAIHTLAGRVNPAVVQVFASGYGVSEDRATPNAVTRQRVTGSGVIISADGYIVTNGHVIANASRVQLRLPSERPPGTSIIQPGGPLREAKVIGVDRETDLALLKVEASNLAFLSFGDSDSLRQGELVMAFGSPRGMENSMSMGVVSSKARQIKPDDPVIYVQTDASINPGNSGGPLVDSEGRIVGINTFIVTQSGGSEGLGFAVPSNIVKTVYAQLRDKGRVHRSEIGAYVQSITPALAAALRLPQDWGVLVSDVAADGPAARSGLAVNDIVLSMNGKSMENARQFDVNLYRYDMGQNVKLEILRGKDKLAFDVPVTDREDNEARLASLIDPAKGIVAKLGIMGIEIDRRIAAALPDLRQKYGIVVAARAGESSYAGDPLQIGDVVVSVNGVLVTGIEALNRALAGLKDSDPLVLYVQRGPGLRYLTLEIQ